MALLGGWWGRAALYLFSPLGFVFSTLSLGVCLVSFWLGPLGDRQHFGRRWEDVGICGRDAWRVVWLPLPPWGDIANLGTTLGGSLTLFGLSLLSYFLDDFNGFTLFLIFFSFLLLSILSFQ